MYYVPYVYTRAACEPDVTRTAVVGFNNWRFRRQEATTKVLAEMQIKPTLHFDIVLPI